MGSQIRTSLYIFRLLKFHENKGVKEKKEKEKEKLRL